MAFELTLQATAISADGQSLTVSDVSVWADSANPRVDHALLIEGSYKLSATPSDVAISAYDAATVIDWTALTPQDGRFTFTAYAFFIKGGAHAPISGDVQWDDTAQELQQYNGATWDSVVLADVKAKAVETSADLEVPGLSQAYIYRNQINLTYVQEVKREIDGGAKQNRLFYKRLDLDYFISLIMSAEYNWSMGLYTEFYSIVTNLNSIVSTGKIS